MAAHEVDLLKPSVFFSAIIERQESELEQLYQEFQIDMLDLEEYEEIFTDKLSEEVLYA